MGRADDPAAGKEAVMPENIVTIYREQPSGARSEVTSLPVGPDFDVKVERDEATGRNSVVIKSNTPEGDDAVLLKTLETVRGAPASDPEKAKAALENEGGVFQGVDPGEDAAVDPEAPGAGTAAQPTGPSGSTVGTGQPGPEESAEEADAEADEEADAEGDEYNATAAAVARAEELGVDLSTVEGTGAGGRITVGDVEAAAE